MQATLMRLEPLRTHVRANRAGALDPHFLKQSSRSLRGNIQTKTGWNTQCVHSSMCQIKANPRAVRKLCNQKWRAVAAAAEMTLNINNTSEDFLALNKEKVRGWRLPQPNHLQQDVTWWALIFVSAVLVLLLCLRPAVRFIAANSWKSLFWKPN